MTITVRRATEDDLPWLLGELKSFSTFLGSRHPIFGTEEDTREVILNFIRNFVVFIAASDSERMGFIGGYIGPHPFNPKITVATEAFWWVNENHRRSRAGVLLLNAFVEFGKANAEWITMALEAFSPVNDRCLLKRGFKLQEKAYLLEVY